MRDVNEALERIDSSFQFTLEGREEQSLKQYHENWDKDHGYQWSLDHEQNITVPGEGELVDRLTDLSKSYGALGDTFYKGPKADRDALYFGKDQDKDKTKGLYALFLEIKTVSGDILLLNENNMRYVDEETKRLARSLLIWYSLGLLCGIVLAVFLVANTIRLIAYPVRGDGVGGGHRGRQSRPGGAHHLGRRVGAACFGLQHDGPPAPRIPSIAQGPVDPCPAESQATIDSFPEPVWWSIRRAAWRWAIRPPAASSVFRLRSSPAGPLPVREPPEALRQPLADALHEHANTCPKASTKSSF